MFFRGSNNAEACGVSAQHVANPRVGADKRLTAAERALLVERRIVLARGIRNELDEFDRVHARELERVRKALCIGIVTY